MAVAKLVAPYMISHGQRAELLDLIRRRSLKTGTFTLSSGKESSLYFNMKATMLWPRGAELAARELLDVARLVSADYIGGLEMGAVPLIGAVAGLSSVENQPIKTFFVRKEAKKHGTRDVIEGLAPQEALNGKRVLIVDDVATSGQSIMKAINATREVGGVVEHAVCLVNRDEDADHLLADNGVKLHSVFHTNDFMGTR